MSDDECTFHDDVVIDYCPLCEIERLREELHGLRNRNITLSMVANRAVDFVLVANRAEYERLRHALAEE